MTSNATAKTVSQASYNRAVKSARTAAANVGKALWIIGDAAGTVDKEYGKSKIDQFADDIKVDVTTVRSFRKTAATFPADVKVTLADGTVALLRDLQSPTIYGIFTSQDDGHKLVTDGNDGAPWTVSAARALVKSRRDAAKADGSGDGDGDSDSNGDVVETDEAKLARLQAYRTQLAADLVKTDAAIAELERKMGPAMHNIPGVPEHPAAAPRTDCPTCQADGIVPMPAPRTRKSRTPAAA